MTSFTYTITSFDSVINGAVVSNQANNVKIITSGFSIQYKYFKCKVLDFNFNYQTINTPWRDTKLFHLICDNLVAGNRPTCSNRSSEIITSITGTGQNNNIGNEFIIANLNGKTLNFQLVDQTFNMIPNGQINQTNPEVTAWVLSLLITPIDNDPTNQSLRYGL